MASKIIHTRAYPDPNPPEIVDNPEKLLRKSPTSKHPAIVRPIQRVSSIPRNLAALLDTQFNLPFIRNPSRTKSLSGIDQIDFEPKNSQHNSSRETSPSTPPDLHFIHNFGFCHPKSTQQFLAGPSTSVTPTHTSTIQTTPLHHLPPLVNPPFLPQAHIMATWCNTIFWSSNPLLLDGTNYTK